MATDWIQTYTGRKFFPLVPDPEQIVIEDIAHSLSMQCRYAGHTKEFYSVAQHSVLLSDSYFPREWVSDIDLSLYALLHDAAEAYLTDIPRPLKHLPDFRFYRDAEGHLERVIFTRFGLSPNVPKVIKEKDTEILTPEANRFMAPLHPDWKSPASNRRFDVIVSWSPEVAKQHFLALFEAIQTERDERRKAA